MKKYFFVLTLVAAATIGAHAALAQSVFVPLAPIPNLTQGVVANQQGLVTFFEYLYKYLIGAAAVLAIIEIIWGGFQISTTTDSVSQHSAGVERIRQAILGLVLVLSPVLVFSIINPSILNLSVNIPPLQTVSGFVSQDSAANQTSNSSGGSIQSVLNTGEYCLDISPGGTVVPICGLTPTECAKQVQTYKTNSVTVVKDCYPKPK